MVFHKQSHACREEAWDDVSKNYLSEVISPLKHSINNPIQIFLNSIDVNKYTVVDLGCGVGNLLEYIVPVFKEITAIDISQGMLDQAKIQASHLITENKKINFLKKNLSSMRITQNYDYLFAINSLINGEYSDLMRSFNNISKLMHNKSVFVGVFPALESIQREFRNSYEYNLKIYQSKELAMSKTKKDLHAKRIESNLGLYYTDDMIQKYYTKFELEEIFEKLNLKIKTFDQVLYNKECSYNYGDQNHSNMFDWFVIATK